MRNIQVLWMVLWYAQALLLKSFEYTPVKNASAGGPGMLSSGDGNTQWRSNFHKIQEIPSNPSAWMGPMMSYDEGWRRNISLIWPAYKHISRCLTAEEAYFSHRWEANVVQTMTEGVCLVEMHSFRSRVDRQCLANADESTLGTTAISPRITPKSE